MIDAKDESRVNQAKRMSNPLVSVVIPVYNTEKYLAEAIRSVLAQTYRPLEIIVVDDQSTDNSAAVARSFADATYYRSNSHSGIGPTRNLGVQHVKGQFLSFLDADDLWPPDKISWQIAAMAESPSRDIIFGQIEQFRSPELPAIPGEEASFAAAPGYFASAMLIETAQFLRVGLFPSAFRLGEFMDWYSRAQEAGLHSHVLPQVVLRRRIHETNTGILERQSRGDYIRILRAALNRRRSLPESTPLNELGQI
jgi:glycosyltransferase involved in cell wall biosynthesis